MALAENKEPRAVPVEEFNPYPTPDVMTERLYKHPARDEILAYLHENNKEVAQVLFFPRERRGSIVDIGILRHLIAGNIEIYPFHRELLTDNGYDVCLGEYYYIHDGIGRLRFMATPIYNGYESENIDSAWGEAKKAIPLKELAWRLEGEFGIKKLDPVDIDPEDLVILLDKGATMLGHTQQFIGGRNVVTTRISGKSTVGRHMFEVCSDANLGDVGFINRWTLEITNKSQISMNPLVAGTLVATITFEEVEEPIKQYNGQYQKGRTIKEIVESWTPRAMLPKKLKVMRKQKSK